MWRCKKCGGKNFKIEIDGFIELDLKKNGDFDYKKDTLNVRNIHSYINCCDCGSEAESVLEIEEIAEWVEDDERD